MYLKNFFIKKFYSEQNQTHVTSFIEKNFKDQSAAVCSPNTFFNFQMQTPLNDPHFLEERSASSGTFNSTSKTTPQKPDLYQIKEDLPIYDNNLMGTNRFQTNRASFISQLDSAILVSSIESPLRAHTQTPHSNSYSTSNSSHPASNETIIVESPGNIQSHHMSYTTSHVNPQLNVNVSYLLTSYYNFF